MKRFFIPLAGVLCVSLLILVSLLLPATRHFSAKASPSTSEIVGQISADTRWAGGVRGVQVNFTLSNPSVNCANGEGYERYVALPQSTSSDYSVYAGEVLCANTDNLWGCTNDTLSVFLEIDSPSGQPLYTVCDSPLSNNDVNKLVDYQIDDYTSGGGGVNVWEKGEFSGHHYNSCNPCSYFFGRTNTFGSITLYEIMSTANFTGHRVWGSEWVNNQYDSTSGNGWHFQGNGGTVVAGDPVQMGWHSVPAGSSNNGGTLYSCVYSSGTYTSCVLGS